MELILKKFKLIIFTRELNSFVDKELYTCLITSENLETAKVIAKEKFSEWHLENNGRPYRTPFFEKLIEL